MNDKLALTFLGSGNAFAPGRYWSSFLVNGQYLFDAPPTLLPHLKQLGIPPEEPRVIFISHFHGDHFLGLPFLFLEYVYLTKRQEDLIIVGPPGIQGMIETVTDLAYPGLSEHRADYQRRYIEVEPRQEQTAGDVTFTALPMKHALDRLRCFGYRMQIGQRVVAYSGDTMYCPELLELAQGADVFVVDSTYKEDGPEHMSIGDVRRLRKEIDSRTAMVLTHLEDEPDVSVDEGLIVAHDFETYTFPV